MKKLLYFLLIISIIFSSISVSAVEQTVTESAASLKEQVPDSSVTEGCHSVDAQRGIIGERQLITNCTAAFLYEYSSETLMYSWNGDMQIDPASMVKIMTALIAIEQGNLNDKVTVKTASYASLPHDASMIRDIPFKDGEILSLEDMLNCMMIGSGNDAAITIAEHISGTQDAFVAEMNRYAVELGCTNTNFTNPHGLYDANQYSTCRDITRILKKAMEYESFQKLFGAIYYNVPETNMSDLRVFKTTNFHLTQDLMETYYDGRVTGGRTGVSLNDERCIASTASKDGLDMICIITGAKTVYAENGYSARRLGGFPEVSDLLDYGFDGFKSVQILYDGQILQQVNVENGECDLTVGSRKAVSTIVPKDIFLEDLNFVYSDTSVVHSAPIKKDQYISTVRISYGNLCLAEADLYAMNSVKRIDESYKIAINDPGSNVFLILILIIIAIVAVIFIFLVWPRVRRMRIQRKRNKKRYGERGGSR